MFNPATLLLIAQAISAAVAAAPSVIEVIDKAKAFIESLFSAGLIDKATQDALFAHVDEVCNAALNGTLPPEFTVEPDPQ